MPVFLPWSLDPDYRRAVDADFVLDADENKIAELHGLDKEQMAWRRAKIAQLGSAEYFAQEYPLTPSEAFISSTFDGFILARNQRIALEVKMAWRDPRKCSAGRPVRGVGLDSRCKVREEIRQRRDRQLYGSLGPASPVRRIDPKTGCVIEVIETKTWS